MCIYQDVKKNGAFHIGIQKNRAIHILFVEKMGPIIYMTVLEKGAIRHAHPYYAIYRKLPPPPECSYSFRVNKRDSFFRGLKFINHCFAQVAKMFKSWLTMP